MKLRYLSAIWIGLLVAISFGGGYALAQSPAAPVALFGAQSSTPDEARESFTPFWEVWNLVHRRYFDQPVDDDLLTEGAIEGMLAALDDPHTRYLSPEDEASAREDLAGEFQGIGAEVEEVDGDIVIVSPLDGSPAEAVGLLPGDILRQADGVDLKEMDLEEVVRLVRGPAGSTVRLQIERDGELFEVTITRDVIPLASVRGRMLEDGIAYVRLSRFGNRTAEEMEEVLNTLVAEEPIGLILDLRRNPGGSLDIVVEVADQFLPEGIVLLERFGDGRENVFKSDDEGLAQDIPMVVLIDEGSASASEVLAGALRDRGRSQFVGQTSFGKGTVQTWNALSNGGGVRITVARWLTPDEFWVNDQGLEPDYAIPLAEDARPGQAGDTQLQAAVDLLLGRDVTSVTSEPGG